MKVLSGTLASMKPTNSKALWRLLNHYAGSGGSCRNRIASGGMLHIRQQSDAQRCITSSLTVIFSNAGNVTWHYTVPSSGAYSLIDPKAYNRTLMDAIVDANNLIFSQRYRNASWIVVGTTTAARLEKLDEFRLFPAADPVGTIVYGPHLFGTVSGRWTVYKDPWLDVTGSGGGPVGGAETMLLG